MCVCAFDLWGKSYRQCKFTHETQRKKKRNGLRCDNNNSLGNDSNKNYKVVSKRAIGENRLVTKDVMPKYTKKESVCSVCSVFPIADFFSSFFPAIMKLCCCWWSKNEKFMHVKWVNWFFRCDMPVCHLSDFYSRILITQELSAVRAHSIYRREMWNRKRHSKTWTT